MDVFLTAYINKNFGDDLFVDMICRRYPQHIFHVVGSEIIPRKLCLYNNWDGLKAFFGLKWNSSRIKGD